MKKILLFAFVSLIMLTSTAFSATKTQSVNSNQYQLDTVFQTKGVIWSFSFLSPDELLISLREGQLYYYNTKSRQKKLLAKIDTVSSGQGGLLDVHYHSVGKKDYVYFTFSQEVGRTVTTSLGRGLYKDNALKNIETLFQAKINKGNHGGIHFGSRLLFSGDYIYMTVGDRGQRNLAQDLSYHNGKILRLTLDGKPVKENSFAEKKNALPEIWSYGHRNPQGIDLDPLSKNIYNCEFGPRGGDELNLVEDGKNYGWPVITYGREYHGPKIGTTHKEGMEQPVAYWVPSISPSGMSFYRGDKFKKWKNNLFLANLSSTHLRRLVLKNGKVILQEELFKDLGERIRHVRTGLDGYLYFSTDSGKIIRIAGKSS